LAMTDSPIADSSNAAGRINFERLTPRGRQIYENLKECINNQQVESK
jgi:hypothetical protein